MRKKLLSIILILLIGVPIFIPYSSYAQDRDKENQSIINENSSNKACEGTKTEEYNTEKNEETKINNVQEKEKINTKTEENSIEEKTEIEKNYVEENNKANTEKQETNENIESNETTVNNIETQKLETEEESVKLEEGIYKIVLANAPTQSITVNGGRKNDGANVHIWEYVGAKQQQFEIKYDSEGYCEIIPMHSNKRLDVVGWGNEANVDQWSENEGNDNQKWTIKKSSRGNYNIVSKREGRYLDAYWSRTSNGTNIQVYEQSGGNGQEFKIVKIGDKEDIPSKTLEEGTYKIVMATNTHQSLTVDGGKTNNGANVHLWEYVNSPQQQFNLVYDGNGYYEIIPINSGKRLDVVGWENEANVDQWSANGGNDNQKWQIKKSKFGNYNIVSKREGRYLDAYQSKIQNETNIQVYEQSGGNGQEFKLEKIADKSEKTIKNGEYRISPRANYNIVIEASASNTDNNGILQVWQDYKVSAQRLNLEYVEGYYKISLNHSGKYLTAKNGMSNGAEIVQYDWTNEDNQKWAITEEIQNGLVISPISNKNLVITIKGSLKNGSKLYLSTAQNSNNQLFYFEEVAKYTVVLNAGHGGSETGCANGWNTIEKNVTLQIARKIRDRLSSYPEIEVILTRDGDYTVDLHSRAMVAWNNRADLYVSLHINDEASHTTTGSEVYVPWYEGTKQYNSKMSYLARLIQDNLSAIGIRANKYGGTVKKNIDWEPKYQYLVNGQVERADYYEDIRDAMKGDKEGRGTDLSLGMGIPTVLVEHCYMNSSDYNFLNASWKIDQLGDADANAIIKYFEL